MSRFDRAIGMVALALILGFSVWFTHWTNQTAQRRAEENNRRSEVRQCELIAIEVRFYQATPPPVNEPARVQRAKDYQDIWNKHCAERP